MNFKSTGVVMLVVSTVCATMASCSAPAAKQTATARPTEKKQSELDKLMRERMNKVFSTLIFQVFHSDEDLDFAAANQHAAELKEVVTSVRNLPLPPMVTSDEAKQVFFTYNDALQSQAEGFANAVGHRDRPNMEALLTKIGQTCNQCHHFFRLDIKDAPER